MFTGVPLISTRYAEGPGGCQSGLCAGEEVDGVKNTTTLVTETVLVAFLEDFQIWDCLPLLLMYQGFHNISIQVKGILLYIKECKIAMVAGSKPLMEIACKMETVVHWVGVGEVP